MTVPVFVDTNACCLPHTMPRSGPASRAAASVEFLCAPARAARTHERLQGPVRVLRQCHGGGSLNPVFHQEDAWDDVKALFTWHPHPIDVALLERGREIEERQPASS